MVSLQCLGSLGFCVLLSSLRISLGYFSYFSEKSHMCIVGHIKEHFFFPLALLCPGNVWEKVLLIKEGRSLARKAVTDLVALARPLSALGFIYERNVLH